MPKISQIWHKIVSGVESAAEKIGNIIEPKIQEMMKAASHRIEQFAATVGAEAFDILKKEIKDGLANKQPGEDIGSIISSAAKNAVKDIEPQFKASATNAVYGAIADILADPEIQAPAAQSAPTNETPVS